jgi:hypothetical protein
LFNALFNALRRSDHPAGAATDRGVGTGVITRWWLRRRKAGDRVPVEVLMEVLDEYRIAAIASRNGALEMSGAEWQTVASSTLEHV